MKAKIMILIGIVALVTLSFTFVQVGSPASNDAQPTIAKTPGSEPVGGFASMEITK